MELLSDNLITKESDDTFGFGFFVDILGKAILDTKYLPVTVGIFGEWGTGKTSLMRLLCKRLESNECKTIWFNPWKYDSKEELWAALIRSILLEIMIEVRPEWYIDGIGSDITLNKRDLQKTCTKFCGS